MFHHTQDSFLAREFAKSGDLPEIVFNEPAPKLTFGLVAGTMIETGDGWAPVEALAAGMEVQTFDGALRKLIRVERSFARVTSGPGLVHIPAGALPGVSEMRLLPDQLIMVSSEIAEAAYGTPDLLVPAAAYLACPDVDLEPRGAPLDLTTLAFEEEEIIFAGGDVLALCPSAEAGRAALNAPATSEFWTVLSLEDGLRLVSEALAATKKPKPVYA